MLAVSFAFVFLEIAIYQFRFTHTPLRICRRLNICCGYHYDKSEVAEQTPETPATRWGLPANMKILGRVQERLQQLQSSSSAVSGRDWVANPFTVRKRDSLQGRTPDASTTQPGVQQGAEQAACDSHAASGAAL